jgi:Xaa-Pro aminopeptidase
MTRSILAAAALVGVGVGAVAVAVAVARADETLGPVPAATAKPGYDLAELQGLMAALRLDGWLLYDFRGQNPIAASIVRPQGARSRRWFYLIPAKGEPMALVHKIEVQSFEHVPGGKIEFAAWKELDAGLAQLLKGRKRLAMEYSPGGSIPYLSRVDAGTVEMVRAHGVEVVSSAELVQATKSRWDDAGRASHFVAVHHLLALKDEAFQLIADEIRAGHRITEHDVAERIHRGFAVRGLEGGPPIVAVGANAANPHYQATPEHGQEIVKGDLVLIDVSARVADNPQAIYGDLTFMAYVGEEVPKKYADVFAVVAKARDDTVAFIADRVRQGKPVRGFEADDVAREVIARAGYGAQFIHRTGHSIDTQVHGDGANLDDFETHDVRTLISGAGFSVEPGIYLPGDFGVRSEIDCHIEKGQLEVTVPQQMEIVPLLRK